MRIILIADLSLAHEIWDQPGADFVWKREAVHLGGGGLAEGVWAPPPDSDPQEGLLGPKKYSRS